MALRNERLDRIHNNSKGIYDTFQYRPENGDVITITWKYDGTDWVII